MPKQILVPTDFSKNALNAINYALKLFKGQECDFYLLNVFGVSGYSLDNMMVPEPGEMAYEAAKNKSEEELQKLLRQLQFSSEHTFHTISVYNSLLDAIRHTLTNQEIDMIVMGTKGSSGAARVFFGSNTVEVMEKITTSPVLAVPENEMIVVPEEIVFPTDFLTGFKHIELQYLLEIAMLQKAVIKILHIGLESDLNKAQQENRALLESLFQEVEHTFHFRDGNKISAEIKDFIKDSGCNMLAFVNRKHGFFENIFYKPLVKEIGYQSEIPILALHDSP
ncbi:universal stress protein UspA [Arenibacter sp. H213]|nr:universal stress protein UspA [Arenibacter sp. H213]